MKRLILGLVVIALAVTLAAVALAANTPAVAVAPTVAADPSPQQQIATLKAKLRNTRLALADARDQIDAQNGTLGDQADTIARLRYRIANWPDPLDVILARDADAQWAAVAAIWRAFPTLPAGNLCGYDKSSTQNDGLTPASLAFYHYAVC